MDKRFDPESLDAFPTGPGVYLMKDRAGAVIYVGKAANLRSRVRSYFNATGDSRFSVQFLRRQVAAVECIVTANEKEAFLLENTLIKQHQPRYNIQLRDDKTFISLRFRMNHPYPRLETVRIRPTAEGRKAKERDDLYFGPFTSAHAARDTMRFLLKVFPVRTCKDSVFRNRTRPCLLYDVGKCCGPCVLPVAREEYAELVRGVTLFLIGRNDEVRRLLAERMQAFSDATEFERAAIVRDRIAALDETLEKQQASTHETAERDVVAVASRQGRSLVAVLRYRGGVLEGSDEWYVKNYEQDDAEVLYSFIQQHYEGRAEIPPQLLVNCAPADRELLEEWLRDQRGGAAAIHVPQRGDLARLAKNAAANAEQGLVRRLAGERTGEELLEDIGRKLGLEKPPRVIECVDISNIMGVLAVGSLVRFEDGMPAKSGYRMYKIRTVEGSNDFAMMREVLTRRFRPGDGGAPVDAPDLLMVDGGKGQLGVAAEVFESLGVRAVALCSIAKARLKVREVRGVGDAVGTVPDGADLLDFETEDEGASASASESVGASPSESPSAGAAKVRFRTQERIFLPGRKNPVVFPPNSPALFLLQRVRDEAHRFAITYHKKLRQKANRKSVLDEVPGVGEVRKRALLRHFGSLAGLRAASLEEVAAVPGVGSEAARNVHAFLNAPPGRVEGQEEMFVLEAEEAGEDGGAGEGGGTDGQRGEDTD